MLEVGEYLLDLYWHFCWLEGTESTVYTRTVSFWCDAIKGSRAIKNQEDAFE